MNHSHLQASDVPPATLNDVLMSMFDYTIGEMIGNMKPGVKKIAARDGAKMLRGLVKGEIDKLSEEDIKEAFGGAAVFAAQFAKRIEAWGGEENMLEGAWEDAGKILDEIGKPGDRDE